MRVPTFSRQSGATTETEDRAPVGPRAGHADGSPKPAAAPPPPPPAARTGSDHAAPPRHAADSRPGDSTTLTMNPVREPDTRPVPGPPAPAPVAAGPKPRASLLATLGLITGVGGALLVLSGPLTGYGIGVAGLALVLSLAGLRATRKRHVAGKSDALIGLVLALGAIAVGVLALTGSLSWAGTDVQPVNNLREWLDAQFIDRF